MGEESGSARKKKADQEQVSFDGVVLK